MMNTVCAPVEPVARQVFGLRLFWLVRDHKKTQAFPGLTGMFIFKYLDV